MLLERDFSGQKTAILKSIQSIQFLATQKRIQRLDYHSSECVVVLVCVFFGMLSQSIEQLNLYLLGVIGEGYRFELIQVDFRD